MIHENLELHNTVELEPAAGGGVCLRRFPRAVREAMGPLGRMVAQESAGCEVRFVTDADNIRVAVSALPSNLAPYEIHKLTVCVFKGAVFHSQIHLEAGKVNHLHLTDITGADRKAFLALRPEVRDTEYFSHRVWRLLFGRYEAVLHEVDTYGYPVRPPSPEETPRRRILFYGSSITNGASPTSYHLCYAQLAARLLKADPLNQGLSGSCLCERETADYLASREDWDLAVLELGVNMRGAFTPDDFRTRSRHLLESILRRHPEKPVALVTIFPNAQNPEHALVADAAQRNQTAFDEILREHVRELRHPELHLIEGRDILRDYAGITKDLIHPGDYGHIEMGTRLAAALEALVTAPAPA